MSERPHLSISQIEMLGRCEMQWYFRYGLGMKSPPGVAALIGKATHKAIEHNLKAKMAGWGPLGDDEIKTLAADAARTAWEKEPPATNPDDPDQGQAIDMAAALASLHGKTLAPKIDPIGVEVPFMVELPQLTHDLIGVVDIETTSHIRDTKTKGRAPQYQAARRSVQLAAYSLRSPGKSVALDYLVKVRNPYALTVEAEVSDRERLVVLKRVEVATEVIKRGTFKPANPGDWCCSEKWCGYWNVCDYGAKDKVSVGLIDPARLVSRIIPHPHADTQEDADVSG